MDTHSNYHNQDRVEAIKTHIEQSKERIISPVIASLTFPENTTSEQVSRFRKNLREKIAHHVANSKYKCSKINHRKSSVFTVFAEDTEKEKRRHYHAILTVSGHLIGTREHLQSFIDEIWNKIHDKQINISKHFHRDLYQNEEEIFSGLTYFAKKRQLPEMSKHKKSFSGSHWNFIYDLQT